MSGGIHFHFKKDGVGAGVEGARFGNELGGFPVGNLAVIESCGEQHGGIGGFVKIVVRAVGKDVIVSGLVIGVAPLGIVGGGEREGRIHHVIHDIDEGNGEMDGLEQVRTHVDYRAHEQASGAATFDEETIFGSPLLLDEVFGTVNEIVEGVLLVHELAIVVPMLAHVVAAANVRDDESEAAVEQDQARGRKVGGRTETIGTVSVKKERASAIAWKAFLVDD